MSLDERIPSLSDAELKTLRANAQRVSETGGTAQKAEAERLLPLIDAELAERRARAPARPPRKTAVKKTAAKKAAPKKAAAKQKA